MANSATKVAVACQGGGTHAAFEVGVLSEILKDLETRKRFDLVGLSGTSAGALCAMMVWYGLAPKKGRAGSGSVAEAIEKINTFWDGFAANTPAELMLNTLSVAALRAQEQEVPMLGINMPIFGLNPRGVLDDAMLWQLRQLGAREEYYDFDAMLNAACPEFNDIDWPNVSARVLLGASEIVDGVETVFDSDCNVKDQSGKHIDPTVTHRWRQRLPLSLHGVAASGTLPSIREAEQIDGGYYWDGLYSQNPPIREFLAGVQKDSIPDEIWVLRINPQQWASPPKTNAEIRDRQNELTGNLSLNKELDFILIVNDKSGEEKALSGGKNDLKARLQLFGVSKQQAEHAVELYEKSYITENLDLVEQQYLAGKVENLPAYTMVALKTDYRPKVSPYEAIISAEKQKKKGRLEEEKRQQEKRARLREEWESELLNQKLGRMEDAERKQLEARFQEKSENNLLYQRYREAGFGNPVIRSLFRAFAYRELMANTTEEQFAVYLKRREQKQMCEKA